MKIFTPVWGEKFLTLMEKCLLPSLAQPLNKKAIEGAQWLVASSERDITKAASLLPTDDVIRIIPNHSTNDPKGFIGRAVAVAAAKCLEEKESLLLAMPDTFFFDGTVSTLKLFEGETGVCVGFAHPRVLPSFLDEVKKPMPDWFYHAHASFMRSEIVGAENLSAVGGISWRRLHNNMIGVQHRLPTTYFANFLPEDHAFFKEHPFSAWDHIWPSTWTGRLRFIGSSDAAFAVEVTDAHTHVGRTKPLDPAEPDKYDRELPHHKNNRQFVSIWRI